ncbi:MAG: LysR family transcriptional regulator [Syntrophobacterales bacterium]|jgi:DNA-binding transcriptional LysR family regulator
MEWQQIVGFHQVAQLGSFTKAAEATFRTQSALSQQVKALEEELGCRLLERIGKRKLRLTEAGERFLRFTQSVLGAYAGLQEELQELKGIPAGELRLAAPFTTLYHLFREVLREYPQRFPQVRLAILDRSQPEVIDLVRQGEVDFGLALASAAPKDLTARSWQEVEMVLMTPRDHPLTRLQEVTIEEIVRYPLILPPRGQRSPGRQTLEALFQQQGLDYRVVMESSNVELSSLYVELGLGISFATVVKDLPLAGRRSLAFLPMSHYVEPDFIAVLHRKDKIISAYLQAFLDLLFAR